MMSLTSHTSLNGIVEQVLGLSGRLSARLLILLTSGPVLRILVALALVLAIALLLRLLMATLAARS
jgi:hypothetical protein